MENLYIWWDLTIISTCIISYLPHNAFEDLVTFLRRLRLFIINFPRFFLKFSSIFPSFLKFFGFLSFPSCLRTNWEKFWNELVRNVKNLLEIGTRYLGNTVRMYLENPGTSKQVGSVISYQSGYQLSFGANFNSIRPQVKVLESF